MALRKQPISNRKQKSYFKCSITCRLWEKNHRFSNSKTTKYATSTYIYLLV